MATVQELIAQKEALERQIIEAQRQAKADGTVRWLRPEFQQCGGAGQANVDTTAPEAVGGDDEAGAVTAVPVSSAPGRPAWPSRSRP